MKSFTQVFFGILVFAFLPVGSGNCGDFEISVTSFPDTIVLGMLIESRITVQNTAGKELTIPRRLFRVQIHDESGNPAKLLSEIEELTVAEPANWKGRKIEAGWKHTFPKDILFADPGKYTVQLFIDSHGPYVNGNGVAYEAWEGTVEKVLSATVTRPEGVDRKVFNALSSNYLAFMAGPKGPNLILRKYPTSTYASYLVWRLGAREMVRQDIETIAKRMKSGVGRLSKGVPCDKPESECPSNGWMRLRGREFLDWRIRWLRTTIQNHPNMWFAEENQLQLAIDLYRVGDQEAAFAGLESLKETASSAIVKATAQGIHKAIHPEE